MYVLKGINRDPIQDFPYRSSDPKIFSAAPRACTISTGQPQKNFENIFEDNPRKIMVDMV